MAAALAAAGRDVPQPPTEPAAPDDLAGWVRIAQTHLAFGRPVQAKAAFAEAIARNPTNMGLLLGYAEALFDAPRDPLALPPESLRILRNLLAVDADNPGALWLLAVAEADAGDDDAAAARLRRLLDLLPTESHSRAVVGARLEALAAGR